MTLEAAHHLATKTKAGRIARIMNGREATRNVEDRRIFTATKAFIVTVAPSITEETAGKELYSLQIIPGNMKTQLEEFTAAINA